MAAARVVQPMSEAEAYVAEGAREISKRLRELLDQRRRSRRTAPREFLCLAASHPVVSAAALIAGAMLALVVADRLSPPPR